MTRSVSLSILNFILLSDLMFFNWPKLFSKWATSTKKSHISTGFFLIFKIYQLSYYFLIFSQMVRSLLHIDSSNYFVFMLIFYSKECQRYSLSYANQLELTNRRPFVPSFNFSYKRAWRTSSSSQRATICFGAFLFLWVLILRTLKKSLQRMFRYFSQQSCSHSIICFWVICVDRKSDIFWSVSETILLHSTSYELTVRIDLFDFLLYALLKLMKLELRLLKVFIFGALRFFLVLMESPCILIASFLTLVRGYVDWNITFLPFLAKFGVSYWQAMFSLDEWEDNLMFLMEIFCDSKIQLSLSSI